MLAWLSQNLGTIVVCIVLAAIVTAIIVYMIKNKKKGKSTCGCGCSNCQMSSICHPEIK